MNEFYQATKFQISQKESKLTTCSSSLYFSDYCLAVFDALFNGKCCNKLVLLFKSGNCDVEDLVTSALPNTTMIMNKHTTAKKKINVKKCEKNRLPIV